MLNVLDESQVLKLVECPPTLQEAMSTYLRLRPMKAASKKQIVGVIGFNLGDWLPLPLNKITKMMVVERHQALSHADTKRGLGESNANLVMRCLKAIYNFAIPYYEDESGQPILKLNPVAQLTSLKLWNKSKRRSSTLKKADMPNWFQALQTVCEIPPDNVIVNKYPDRAIVMRDYLTLIWLTGCRRSEACNLRWLDVDLISGFITFRQTKNGHDHTLPLSDYLWTMLKERRLSVPPEHPYVFPGKKPLTPISNTSKGVTKVITKLSGVPFLIHDLRRCFASTATQIGIDGYTLKLLLNHSVTSDVTAGYICLEPEYLRVHMQRITDTLLALAKYQRPLVKGDDVVVSMISRLDNERMNRTIPPRR